MKKVLFASFLALLAITAPRASAGVAVIEGFTCSGTLRSQIPGTGSPGLTVVLISFQYGEGEPIVTLNSASQSGSLSTFKRFQKDIYHPTAISRFQGTQDTVQLMYLADGRMALSWRTFRGNQFLLPCVVN